MPKLKKWIDYTSKVLVHYYSLQPFTNHGIVDYLHTEKKEINRRMVNQIKNHAEEEIEVWLLQRVGLLTQKTGLVKIHTG